MPVDINQRQRGAICGDQSEILMSQRDTPFLRTYCVLSGLTVIGPLAFEGFLPALNDAAADLGTNNGTLLVTIATMSGGIAIGQLIFGPLSDRFGRRPIVLGGMALYVLSSLFASLINSADPLFALRFFQGLSIACAMVIFRAVVRDLFAVRQGARMFSYLYTTLSVMPLVGPVVSGFLVEIYGWRSVFIMMVLLGSVVFLILLFFFKESLPLENRRSMNPTVLATSFGEIIRDRTFASFLLVGVGTYGGLFAVLGGLAPVMITFMGESPGVFGLQFALIMTGHLIGAVVTGHLVRRYGIKKVMSVAVSISAIGGGMFLAFALVGISTRLSILIPVTIFLIGFALSVAPMTAGAMSNFQHMAGRAASLMGFIQQGTGAMVTFLLSVFDNGTQMPMVLALTVTSCFALTNYVLFARRAPLSEN